MLLVVALPALAVGLAAAMLTFATSRQVAAPVADPAAVASNVPAAQPPPVPANVLGRADAPVEIEEWSDFQ